MTFVVGDYRAIELIGTGGSAQVWRGIAASTGAQVALKVFPPDQLPMARREAALAAAVDHPHVVRVLDVVGDTERAALITEYAAGGDLADLLARRGRLTAGETLTVLLPLAAALATAHERQIVHGDLSAQNVLFDRAGRPLLADLGAGRAAAEGGRQVAVTPPDAAPELARGATPGAASDMFSLGSLALACLTGHHAWPADDLRDVLIQAAAGQWPDPDDADGPPLLISAVRGLLEHDPERRPGAASLVMDLRAAGRPEPLDLRIGPASTRRAAPAADPAGAGRPGALIIGPGHAPDGRPAPTGARHGLATDQDLPRPVPPPWTGGPNGAGSTDPGRSTTAAHEDEHLDLGRVGRARAVTRVRADAVPPSVPTPISRLRRVRSFTLPRSISFARRSSRSGHPVPVGSRPGHRAGVRIVVLAAVTLLVAALAGAGGLWWANLDRTDPVALEQTTAPAAPTGSAASGSAAAQSLPTSRTRAKLRPAPPGTVAPSRSPTVSPARTIPPAPTPVAPRSAASPSSSPPAVSSPAGSTGPTANPRVPDFTATVRRLDDARARALVNRDPALLDAVYTADSSARSTDATTIRSLISGGLRLSGAVHLVRNTKVVGSAPLRVEVADSLPSYSVLDGRGAIVGSTAARSVAARVMVLVNTPAGYRISAVQPA